MELISKADKERIEAQLAECILARKAISERIAEARAQGDLKENADYHAAREDQGHNEAKIRDLEARLARVQVVGENMEVPEDMVFLGAVVQLREVGSSSIELFKLVGSLTDDDSDWIEVTVSSPMGEALMRARIGETIRVVLPRGEKRFEVVAIVA
ncbi:MAG: transcription elongation factor GreA [Phycisphaeraceae bacterium]|nr:transcription elongation factor GreA [Phycisphaeraceae bacterium]